MSIPLAILVRLVVLGAGLGIYYAAVPSLLPDDDGLGAGLIAFAALVLISLVWSVIDGRAKGFRTALIIWAVTAAVFSLGWTIVLAVSGADSSMSVGDLIRADLAFVPFGIGLLLAPAVVGAAVGHVLRPSPSE